MGSLYQLQIEVHKNTTRVQCSWSLYRVGWTLGGEGWWSVCAYPAWDSFMLNRGGAHSFQQQAKQNRPRSQVKAPLSPRAPSWPCSGNQSFGGALNWRRKLPQTAGQHLLFLVFSLLFFAVAFWVQPKLGFKKERSVSIPLRTGHRR